MHAGKIHKALRLQQNACSVYFLVEVLLLLLRAAAAAHNISTEAERGTGYCFLLRLRYYYCCFLCVYSIAVAAVEKGCMPVKTNKKYYFFFFGGCAAAAFHSSRGMC